MKVKQFIGASEEELNKFLANTSGILISFKQHVVPQYKNSDNDDKNHFDVSFIIVTTILYEPEIGTGRMRTK